MSPTRVGEIQSSPLYEAWQVWPIAPKFSSEIMGVVFGLIMVFKSGCLGPASCLRLMGRIEQFAGPT